jgi:crossover junction endodeoxyribonuclease RuvC
MPISQTKSGKNQVDAAALSTLLSVYADSIKFAVVEDVGAMVYVNAQGITRGQGAAASFAFGKAAGVLDGVLSALKIPVVPTKPAVWKMLMGVSADKETSRAKATSLFPNDAKRWSRKMDDGRAEAALLAFFGAMRLK